MIVPSIDLAGGQRRPARRRRGRRRSTPATRARSPSASGDRRRDRGDRSRRRHGRGGNAALIEELVDASPCRVGGGIRDVATRDPLARPGCAQGRSSAPPPVPSLGTAAARAGDRGARCPTRRGRRRGLADGTGRGVLERIAELRELCRRLSRHLRRARGAHGGTDLAFARQIARPPARPRSPSPAASRAPTRSGTSTGSAATPRSAWRSMPASSASRRRSWPPCVTDRPDGLWPTVVVDERGVALGLCLLGPRVDPRGRASTGPGRLPVAHARPLGEGRDQRARPRSCSASTARLRPRRAPLRRPSAAARFLPPDTRTCWGADRASAPSPAGSPNVAISAPPGCVHGQAARPIPTCSGPSFARKRTSWPRRRPATR